MRVIHFSNFAPNRSGLYECTKEQIKYERKYGIDSQMCIFETEIPPKDMIDGDLKPITWEEAKVGDLWILHRGIPGPLDTPQFKKPVITVIHGTADYLVLEDVQSQAEKSGFNCHINLIKDSTAWVAVNQHDHDIYKLYDFNNTGNMIHDAVDCEEYTIEGYQYPVSHHPQIIFADSLRLNKHPAHIIWAMAEVVKVIPEAKLSVYGLDLTSILNWRNMLLRSPNAHLFNNLENIQFVNNEQRPYFRSADILFNSNISGVPSRVEIEAKACGCQVVGYSDSFTKYKCNAFDTKDIARAIIECWNDIKDRKDEARLESRQWVLDNANAEKQVIEKYIPLYKKILKV